MSDTIDPLRQLQSVDTQLHRLRHEQRQKPLELEQCKHKVATQQAAARAVEDRLKAIQLRHKEKEMELSTREASVKKLQGQLFQVETNKEYTAMQHEIDQAKADISLLEEEILKLLEGIDQAKQEWTTQSAALAKEQASFKQEEARVEQQLGEIRQQIAALEQQRQALTPGVPGEALTLYERILNSRDGLALVPLLESSCGGCHMVQPPQIVNEVDLKARIVTCESCSRILYLEPATL